MAKTPLRKKALLIAEAGYEAINIKKTVESRVKIKNDILKINIHRESSSLTLNLDDFKRVFIVGVGKGSALASMELAKILGKRLFGGIALDVKIPDKRRTINNFQILKGTHPLPSKQNIKATQKIMKLAEGLKKNDLLIVFICGGGSALLCGSKHELRYELEVFNNLTKAGADISELNIVRKHLSKIKGGGLTKLAYPANLVSLIVSDVYGNDFSTIASGPTVYDKTVKKDAERVLKKYLSKSAHSSALIRDLMETPKNKKYFKKARNILFACNQDAILGMVAKARKLGLKPKIYSLMLRGEARNAMDLLVKAAKSGEIILAGGETTVNFKKLDMRNEKLGKGGRNMEAVLGALIHSLNSKSYILNSKLAIMSFASDGHDNTEAAGAIGDILTIQKSRKLKLNPGEFLETHNSFNFFKKTGDLIFAKKDSFNVADLMVVLRQAQDK